MKKSLHNLLTVAQLEDIKKTFDGMFRVKAGRGLVRWLVKLTYVIVKKKRSSITRLCWCFIRDCYKLYRKNGMKFLVFYLKTSHVQLMQAMGGYVVKDTSLISKVRVSKTTSGFPRMIPSDVRRRIRGGDKLLLQIYLSFFSLYRVMSFDSIVSLKTIIDPGVKISKGFISEWDYAILFVFSQMGINQVNFRKSISEPKPFFISKSSPVLRGFKIEEGGRKESVLNLSTSILAIARSAVAIVAHPLLWVKYRLFVETLYPESKMLSWMIAIYEKAWTLSFPLHHIHAPLGALGFKKEAAGKVRVFAMVDCWTQWFLKPLHDAIFRVLDRFPTDGTHDQLKPIYRLLNSGCTRFWSYDLSAATDRLPVELQARVLNYLMGDNLGTLWSEILVGRHYQLPVTKKDGYKFDKRYGSSIRYTVGQPMGALSSWAMLALTHHLMVAVAAKRAGFPFGKFNLYAVLGDDIVIANGKVAREYLNVCTDIGVKVGIHKSLISRNGVLEFAKRYFVNGVDCSAVPLIEVASATQSVSAVMELARKYGLTLPQLASVLGAGYKTLSSFTKFISEVSPRWRHLGILYYSPWGIFKLQPFEWLSLRRLINYDVDLYPTQPEGFEALMRRRFEALYRRVDSLRGPLRGFSLGYLRNPCVTVFNQMMDWMKECNISIYSSISGEVYKPVVAIVDTLVLNFRKDLAIAEEKSSSAVFGFPPKQDSILVWNELRHGLSLARRLCSPNKKQTVRILSSAHIWDLWRLFPKRPKDILYPNVCMTEDIGYVKWSSISHGFKRTSVGQAYLPLEELNDTNRWRIETGLVNPADQLHVFVTQRYNLMTDRYSVNSDFESWRTALVPMDIVESYMIIKDLPDDHCESACCDTDWAVVRGEYSDDD